MKVSVLAGALALLVVFGSSCKPGNSKFSETDAGTVVFAGSGVSLVPGEGWGKVDVGTFSGSAPEGVCLPTLAGKGGLIQVLLLPPDQTELHATATSYRARIEADPKTDKGSFQQDEFSATSGASGLLFSFTRTSEKAGRKVESRSHNYVIKNQAGRLVSINYIAIAAGDSQAVHKMIRETLKVL